MTAQTTCWTIMKGRSAVDCNFLHVGVGIYCSRRKPSYILHAQFAMSPLLFAYIPAHFRPSIIGSATDQGCEDGSQIRAFCAFDLPPGEQPETNLGETVMSPCRHGPGHLKTSR